MSDDGGSGEGGSRIQEEYGIDPVLQELGLSSGIAHYYGNEVRRLFIIASVIMILSIPFFYQFIPGIALLQGVGILIFFALAGLTNVRLDAVMVINVFAAGAGAIGFGAAALAAFNVQEWYLFLTADLLALLFLFALYFSVKTVRSMMLGIVGKTHSSNELV